MPGKFALAAAAALFVSTAAAAPSKARPASIDNTPRANTNYLLTTSSRTKSEIRSVAGGTPVPIIDVLTNVIEIDAGAVDFLGGVSVTVRLANSEASAIGQGLQPIDRPSPLAPVIGGTATFVVYPGGSLQQKDVQLPPQGTSPENRNAFAEFAKNVLRPLPSQPGPLKPGDTFESRSTREMPVEGKVVEMELLHRYKIATVSPDVIEIVYQTAVRPRTPDQPEQVYGRGRGAARYDRRLGVMTKTVEELTVTGQLQGRNGWLAFQANTSTESLLQVIKPPKPRRGSAAKRRNP